MHLGPWMRDYCISEFWLLSPTSGSGHRLEPGQEEAPTSGSLMDPAPICTLYTLSVGYTFRAELASTSAFAK